MRRDHSRQRCGETRPANQNADAPLSCRLRVLGDSGTVIEGVADAEVAGALVFHAGTALHGGQLVTNGGRILAVTATADALADARQAAYTAVERIHFPGARYRRDVAAERGERVGG